MLDAIKKSGRHEFGVHGWIHEMNMTLPDSVERALVRRGGVGGLIRVRCRDRR
jgi:hypothetical protein